MCACTRVIPRICDYVYARMYRRCTCRVGVHIRGVHAEDQPPDPFRRCIYRCSLFSHCRFPLSLSFFLAASRLPRCATTIHLSLGLIHDEETLNRVSNNVPGKKLRKEENFLAPSFLPLLARSLARPFLSRRISPFYFACLCREKDSGRGELPCRIQRGGRRETGDDKGVGGEREGQRGRERNDNPFGGHNAEPGTVKLTRQEIRPTNRPLSLRFPPFLHLFPWPLSRPPLCSFTPQRTYPWLYANRHRSLRASHKLTELYYADPLPLCPPRLSSPLCSRDALHSFTFSFFFPLFFL